VSTANCVPETWELTGDDAVETLRRVGHRHLLADSIKRLRAADGFSHARSLAFMVALVIIQATIAVVGLAQLFSGGRLAEVVVDAVKGLIPGQSGQVLTQAVTQAQMNGMTHRYAGLVVGLVGAVITGTTAMGQLERGLNRIYGVEQDRPTVQKYRHALMLALTAGSLATLSFAALAFGRAVEDGVDNGFLGGLWAVVRWPVAFLAIVASVALLFKSSPNRHQPAWSWLAFGAAISVLLIFAITVLLSIFLRASGSFGDTYGPLAGLVALLMWSLLSAISVLAGAAVAAQLEAVRAGAPAPQDAGKAAEQPVETRMREAAPIRGIAPVGR